MTTIWQDTSPAGLIKANEANLAACVAFFAKLGQFLEDQPAGVKRSITDIPFSLFNSIVDTRLDADQVESAVQHIQADARARNVPVLWWVTASTRPPDLASRLLHLGFTLDDEYAAMAIDLAQLRESLPPIPGFTIQPAEGEAAWHQWSRTLSIGFDTAEDKLDFFEEHWSRLLRLADPETALAFTGFLDGQPVATTMLYLATGVAGIYCVSTVPAARRKGIGTCITLHALLQARASGYRAGILQASTMGEPVYQSLGFQVYDRMTQYEWRPEEKQ